MNKRLNSFLSHAAVVLIGIVCLWVFAKILLCPFTDWNFPAEGVSADFINFFWRENFHFFRLPHFDWHSDYMLYPYGVDVTFIFWAFEMNAFGAWAQSVRLASWGQCYYLFSLAITFFGVYALLYRRKGIAWALFFAFALTFCNYASICKYPGHFSHCIVHWGILSVLLDVILVEKFWNGEHVSARYCLGRLLVLLLCFGLELGYIAGFACLSFFVTCVYLLFAKLIQTRSFRMMAQWVLGEVKNVVRTFGASRWNVVFLIAIVLVAWIYLPIIFQIMTNTPPQEKTPIWGTNPLRIFHPILPDFNPAITWTTKQGLMGVGIVDTVYAWSAGLSAVLFAYLGIVTGGPKGIRRWLPFVLLLMAAMVMRQIPLITYFPAFKYARVPERLSPYVSCLLLIPLIFSVCRTGWDARCRKMAVAFALPVFLLWFVELGTAYFCSDTTVLGHAILEKCAPQVAKDHQANPICRSTHTFPLAAECKPQPFSPDYCSAVMAVSQMPGKALFFYPFSAHGGDGKGFTKNHTITAHQMQFAAHCGKKMNGCYLGRMFPEIYLNAFEHDGWPKLLEGDRAWNDKELAWVKSFLTKYDFCAVVINVDKISPELAERVYREFGKPLCHFNSCCDHSGNRYAVIPLAPKY